MFVPTEDSIINGLLVKQLIEDKWCPPNYYFHLRRGGHVRALREHLENKYFIHLDIENFFGQINRSRVTRSLKEHIPYKEARDIAVQSTVRLPDSATRKYILPFGFVEFPIIASVCLSKSALGHHLTRLAKVKGFAVSVYMDDILVSCNNQAKLNDQLALLKHTSEKSGFPLNIKKLEGPDVSVTAFNIRLSQGSLKITPSRLKEFMDAYSSSANEHQRKGILNYILSVNPMQADIFSYL